MTISNPDCCGGYCKSEKGEVRKFPLGGGANLILCRACWSHENQYRYHRAMAEISAERTNDPVVRKAIFDKWPQLNWDAAEVVVLG